MRRPDVFLTPLKPATKSSISAEAINSSLYYLHVSTEEDEAIRQRIEEEQLEERQYAEENPKLPPEDLAHLNHVRRKPVPGASLASPEDARPLPLFHRSSLQVEQQDINPESPPGHVARQSPSPTRPKSSNNQATTMAGEFSHPRKPLPQRRPLPQLPNEGGDTLSPTSQIRRDPSPRRWSVQPESLAVPGPGGLRDGQPDNPGGRFSLDSRRPAFVSGDKSPREENRTSNQFLKRASQPALRRSFDAPRDRGSSRFHVTLIRRDPSYGSQWNVGTISNHESASLGDDSSIDLEILTPAYKQFARESEPLCLADLGINLPSALHNKSNSSLSSPQVLSEQTSRKSSEAPTPLTFTRKVSLLPAYRHHHRFSSSNDSNDPTTRDRSPIKSPTAKTKGVYTFTSPWNGTCAFSMGVNGRSLKCKHTIAEASSNFGAGTQSSSPTVTAAEIRFNLPAFPASNTAANRGRHRADKPRQYEQYQQQQQPPYPPPWTQSNTRPDSSGSGTDPLEKRKSFANFFNTSRDRAQSHSPSRFRAHFHNSRPEIGPLNTNVGNHNNPDPFTSPNDESERLDLGLARERAGGGLRGKSAKLGKIVINDEGLKMLDLVVAACMGVWWKYYE